MPPRPSHDQCPKCGTRKMVQSHLCRACWRGSVGPQGKTIPERLALIRGDIETAQKCLSFIHCRYAAPDLSAAINDAQSLLNALTGARAQAQRIFSQLSCASRLERKAVAQ